MNYKVKDITVKGLTTEAMINQAMFYIILNIYMILEKESVIRSIVIEFEL